MAGWFSLLLAYALHIVDTCFFIDSVTNLVTTQQITLFSTMVLINYSLSFCPKMPLILHWFTVLFSQVMFIKCSSEVVVNLMWMKSQKLVYAMSPWILENLSSAMETFFGSDCEHIIPFLENHLFLHVLRYTAALTYSMLALHMAGYINARNLIKYSTEAARVCLNFIFKHSVMMFVRFSAVYLFVQIFNFNSIFK